MADEYIKKKDIKEKVTAITGEWKDGPEFWVPIEAVLGNIDLLPAEDVAPVRHGRWIKIAPAGIYECSECGKNVMTNDIEAYEYCHGCGAKMDGEIK